MKRITRHLTYANVMSTIAVFLALGGGLAWALGRNSVHSEQIAPNAVKGQDAKESSLAGFKCRKGTRYHAGACIEVQGRPDAHWTAADSECRDDGGRLPTLAELLTFRDEPGITLGVNEWSNDYWRDADDGAAENFYARTLADVGSSADSILNQDLPYRCAFAPS
jgi:hypothetical protein